MLLFLSSRGGHAVADAEDTKEDEEETKKRVVLMIAQFAYPLSLLSVVNSHQVFVFLLWLYNKHNMSTWVEREKEKVYHSVTAEYVRARPSSLCHQM